MPRYRVVLEFDHPGSNTTAAKTNTSSPPNEWKWKPGLGADVTNLDVSVYELQVVEEYVPMEVKGETTR